MKFMESLPESNFKEYSLPNPTSNFRLCANATILISDGLPFPEIPIKVNSAAIKLIHRNDDAYVTFHSKRGDDFADLYSSETSCIKEKSLRSLKKQDRSYYFSINSMFRYNKGRNSRYPNEFKVYRESKGARYLNACFTDIDCYAGNIEPDEIIATIIQMQQVRAIPPVSLIIKSGRGVWGLWLLKDEQEALKSQRATTYAVRLYEKIQQKLFKQFSSLNADANSLDIARITRLDGSINPKNGAIVNFWQQVNKDDQPYFYTLSELAAFYQISVRLLKAKRKEEVDEKTRVAKRKGRIALYEKRRKVIVELEKSRGGFKEGHRNHAILLYANFLRALQTPLQDIFKLARIMGSNCTPPLRKKDCDIAVDQSESYEKFTDQKIADWLSITKEESLKLDCFPCATKYEDLTGKAQIKGKSKTHIRIEQELQVIEELNYLPPTRVMARRLKKEGLNVSHVTISKDYKRLVKLLSVENPQAVL